MEKDKKKLETPHTFVILLALLILAVVLTYFIPAGEYVRYADEESGRILVRAGSYSVINSKPVSFLRIPVIVYQAMVKSSSVFMFLLIIGGSFELVTETGALNAFCGMLADRFKGKEMFVIPLFLVVFSVFGATMGMSTEIAVFIPLGVSLARSLGMDKVTGVSMMAMGATSGFTAGIMNAFNVGVAQDIAEIPIFSGMAYRALLLVVLLAADFMYIAAYTKRVRKNPENSVCYGLQGENASSESLEAGVYMTKEHKAVLLVTALSFMILIYGLLRLGWYLDEMAGVFLSMGIICGIIGHFGPNRIAGTFGKGVKGIVVGALIIGFARSIEVVLSDAMIIDTIVEYIAGSIIRLPTLFQGIGMFIAQSFINVLITSGSGQAVVVMPLMTPVADLIGMSRQTAVLAFQMGDGFSNSILPTSSATMAYLAVADIPFSRWLRFMLPLFLIWTLIGCIFMVGAVAIGY